MKRITTIVCGLLLFSLCSKAQGSYYCLSFADYLIDNWQHLDTLQMERRTEGDKFWYGGASIKPTTGNKQMDKVLKKQARLIRHRDSLYINCSEVACKGQNLGPWYAPAFVYERDYFLFIAPNYKSMKRVSNMSFSFGLIGAAVTAATTKNDYLCYVFNPSTETVEPVDKKMMARLLKDRPDLLERLSKITSKQRYAPEIILPILKELDLVEGL
jgi:hypothetical protein